MEQGICLCYQLHPHFLEDISIFPSFLLSISLVVAFKSKDFGWFIDLSIHADETPHLCWQMTHVAIRVAVQRSKGHAGTMLWIRCQLLRIQTIGETACN